MVRGKRSHKLVNGALELYAHEEPSVRIEERTEQYSDSQTFLAATFAAQRAAVAQRGRGESGRERRGEPREEEEDSPRR